MFSRAELDILLSAPFCLCEFNPKRPAIQKVLSLIFCLISQFSYWKTCPKNIILLLLLLCFMGIIFWKLLVTSLVASEAVKEASLLVKKILQFHMIWTEFWWFYQVSKYCFSFSGKHRFGWDHVFPLLFAYCWENDLDGHQMSESQSNGYNWCIRWVYFFSTRQSLFRKGMNKNSLGFVHLTWLWDGSSRRMDTVPV